MSRENGPVTQKAAAAAGENAVTCSVLRLVYPVGLLGGGYVAPKAGRPLTPGLVAMTPAFRMLLPATACVAGLSCTVQEATVAPSQEPAPYEAPASAGVTTGRPIFREAAASCGLDFQHDNGTTGEFYLPEVTGAGAAVFDFDYDGDLDVYLVQGGALIPSDAKPDDRPRDRLFRNELVPEGRLQFTDATADSGIRAFDYGMGATAGDFNNDGWIDLYVTNLGSNQLWRNQGGTFVEEAAAANADDERWSTSATWFDYDRDGWLDLFIGNYVDFSTDYAVACYSASSARDYCGPDAYNAVPDRLLRNLGDGTFEDATASAGVAAEFGAGLGALAADFNDDGWCDVYVANDGDPNQLWINQQGNG